MARVYPALIVIWTIAIMILDSDGIQCKNPDGQPVDWFTAIKLPKLKSEQSDETTYMYMDPETPQLTYQKDITIEQSAIGHTVAQMYAPTESYNNTIMWLVYNDEPTNSPAKSSQGHSKGMVVADKSSGFWLVHSVPMFPQLPYQNNSYGYPKTGLKNGQSFLCISILSEELDKVGDQLINNEVTVYGSHFGNDLRETYPALYNSTLPRRPPSKDNDGVRLYHLQSIKGFEFLSVSKNRHFGKDLYEDLITHITQSNLYAETWLNSHGSFNSSCSNSYKTMNIKSLVVEKPDKSKIWYKSSKDHSKWAITDQNSKPFVCIGDINRAKEQTKRGGGTVCSKSIKIWKQYKKLILNVDKC